MFNKDLEKRIKELEAEIFPEKIYNSKVIFYFNENIIPSYLYPLKKRVDGVVKSERENRKLLDLLMKKLGLEYVKITEENGDKEVREVIRKIKKNKK